MTEEKPIWEIVEEKFQCDHEHRQLCYRPASNQYVQQCLTCGKTGQAIAHDRLTKEQKKNAVDVDPTIADEWYDGKRDYAEALRNDRKAGWFDNYSRYLRTPQWKEKRDRVLHRDGYMCKACGNGTATQVHHLSYKYGIYTPLYLLESVCTPCHDKLTAIDRGEMEPWPWEEIEGPVF